MATNPKLKTVGDVIDELPDDTLHTAMARAFAEIEAATKDSTNPHFRSKYADLASVIEAVKPALINNGLFFTQRPHPADDGVSVETFVHHRNGEMLSLGILYMPANKRDPQGFGSALTYCKRYGLQTAFGVPTEDDDGNAAVKSTETTSRPTAGETPPSKRVRFDGPYTCPTQLMTAAREFVRTLEGIGDLDEFIAWSETDDYREFCKQLARDMPSWWSTGENLPAEFVPLEIRIKQRRADLEREAGVRDRENA
jgi:hypothetical protein